MIDPARDDEIDDDEIYRMAGSPGADDRVKAAALLGKNFPGLRDKKAGLSCLHTLAEDRKVGVRFEAAGATGAAFQNIPDKTAGWDILTALAHDDDFWVKAEAIKSLHLAFCFSGDKQKAGRDLVRLVQDENPAIRHQVTLAIDDVIPEIPDKEELWDVLIQIFKKNTRSEEFIPDVPHKEESREVLLEAAEYNCRKTRLAVVNALSCFIPRLPDNPKVWHDLHRLLRDNEFFIRRQVIYALALALCYNQNSKEIWNDLHRMLNHDDNFIVDAVVIPIPSVFPFIPDKKHAWKHLLAIVKKENGPLLLDTEHAVFEVLPQISLLATRSLSTRDVLSIWKDLLFLTAGRAHVNRHRAARILADVYPAHPDGSSAWSDILKLTEPSYLETHRQKRVPGDMSDISEWEETDLQAVAYHTLGRICIYQAIRSADEEAFLEYLKNGVLFFETSLEKIPEGNPAQFCSPFYHSLYSIVSGARDAEEEASRYLARAREVVDNKYPADHGPDYEKKRLKLLDAVTSLSSAFTTIYRDRGIQLAQKQSAIDIYRMHCDTMADLLDDAEAAAPVAARAIWRTAFCIDKRVKESFRELEDRSREFCLKSQGTRFETFGKTVHSGVKELGKEPFPGEIQQKLDRIESVIDSLGNLLYSQEKAFPVFERPARSSSPVEQSERMIEILKIYSVKVVELKESIIKKDEELNHLKNTICTRLDTIISGIDRVSASQASHEEWSRQIGQLLQSVPRMREEISRIQETQQEILYNQEINEYITILAGSIEKLLIEHSSSDEKFSQIITGIQNLKQNPADKWLDRFGALASIVSAILPHLGIFGI
jgi:hypothetical protein